MGSTEDLVALEERSAVWWALRARQRLVREWLTLGVVGLAYCTP